MTLRPMTREDNKGVKSLIQSSLKSLGLDKPGTAYYDPELNNLFSFYDKQKKSAYWVIEENGMIVGGVGIAPFSETTCELQKLYVDASQQGKGLAKLLMNQALSFAKDNYEACYLETHSDLGAACRLYEKYDFNLLENPLEGSVHSFMDKWYLKKFIA